MIPSDVPGKLAMGVRAPAGVVVGVAPWNAPVILGTRAVATPLAYANTVVLKASEICPRTHAAIVHALQDAGLPPGVLNLITNAPQDAGDVVDELIAHPATRRINFTGSTKVGRAEKAGKYLKRVLLELGGKAPLVVLANADLDRAVAAARFGAFFHQGQICMSTERIIVDRSAAVFSENVPAALELAQRIESGICHINDTTVHDEPQMPFGGVKASGFGRFGGRAALEEFTELRWITVQQLPRHYPI